MNTQGCPHPSTCQLLYVNRDTLFSFHPVSEKFLQQMMALYVASHYKNSPNDLQLMSDAPAHQLFVLVPPVEENATKLPEPLCVIQVALEGQISKQSVLHGLSRGQRAGGDLIPWLVSQQFQDEEFAGLSGARVVRIATNPDYLNMGYGSRALELLTDFYEGRFTNLSEEDSFPSEEMVRVTDQELENANLLEDNVHVRDIRSMPPLFLKPSERRPDTLDYIGVSYGLTQPLHKFWKRAKFAPVYLRQTPNDLTGEHTCVMLRTLSTGTSDGSWLGDFARDFHKRFLSLLSYQFRDFPSSLSLSIDESANKNSPGPTSKPAPLTKSELDATFSPFDLKRLESYANNLLDYHVILDMVPTLATYYFAGRLSPAVSLSPIQKSLLLAIGLQRKSFDDVEKELGNVTVSQLMAMFIKVIRKISTHFRTVIEGALAESLPAAETGVAPKDATGVHEDEVIDERFRPLDVGLEEELKEGGKEVDNELREKQRALIDALPLDQYVLHRSVLFLLLCNSLY
jgi:N-acetyltransferase 10